MASSIACIAVVLALHSFASAADFLSPIFSPISDEICKKVQCGKGTCKPSNNSFSYECECDVGWKQTRPDDDDYLKFLPCIIPNCSMDSSCGAAPSPVQDKITKSNSSIFDPCFWSNCGGGTCNKTTPFTYSCECKQGYYNLLNVSSFPCFRQCSIGMDCKNLGIALPNEKSSPPPTVLDQNGSSTLPRSLCWLIILIVAAVLIR